MKLKVALFLILIALSNFSVRAQIQPSRKQLEKIYRQYVLTRCIYFAFGEEKVFSEDVSLSIYYAAGNEFQLTNHANKLDSLAKKKLAEISPTQVADYEGRRPIIMRCIEYFQSRDLKKNILKILKIPRKSEISTPSSKS